MMEFVASAPGKQVLLGDYAVLEGAPALVLAVDRRAEARVALRDDGACTVSSPDLDIDAAAWTIDRDGALQWQCDAQTAAKLSLVEHVWSGLLREGLAPRAGQGLHIQLDTSGFFHGEGAARVKLGLGSSAALTVALASALAACAGHADALADRAQWVRRLFAMHGGWQGGRGSGVDVAAAVAGGVISYQLQGEARTPHFMHEAWPVQGVHHLFVWSGQSVSTANSLKHLAQWRTTHAADYVSHMGKLGAISAAAVHALRARQTQSFIGLTKDYAVALKDFGDACGLEIYSAAQKRLAEMAAEARVSYKPCGAGGDFGVVFAEDPERLATFESAIVRADMHVIPLPLDSQGVRCHMRQVGTSPLRDPLA
jgi:phosphomevalonate kinase